jgi:Uma2 family endonuclease
MATRASSRLMTAEDLLRLPDDGHRYELVRGELAELPMSGHNGSRIAIRLATAIQSFVDARDLGHVSGADGAFILESDPDTVRIPDIAFVRVDRLPAAQQWGRFLALAPDLVVEVISPFDTTAETVNKVREYLDAGVQLIWVVHPERRMAAVYLPDRTARLLYEEDMLDGGEVLPDFSIPVADLFRSPALDRSRQQSEV